MSDAAANNKKGRLYLVPAPLDFGCKEIAPLQNVLPNETIATASQLDHWICENAKSTRAFLKRVAEINQLKASLQEQTIVELPREVHKKGDHQGTFDARPLLAAALEGHDIGLISEAGMPAIADPGSSVVRAAHDLGIDVIALVGPISLMLALATSGLNGQSFAFNGYLPQEANERGKKLRELEAIALKSGQTQLFIETPYRNEALLNAAIQALQHNTRLAVSTGLTLADGVNRSAIVKTWRDAAKNMKGELDLALPAVFSIGR